VRHLGYETVEPGSLTPFPGNPCVGDTDAIMASLVSFGQYRTLVVREAGEERPRIILAGNHTGRSAPFVIDHGEVRFAGDSDELTAMAAGRVWQSDSPVPAARLSWLTGDGRYRHVGDPPPDADPAAPTLEDGYLLLLGAPDTQQVPR